jgi:hypothetical protein
MQVQCFEVMQEGYAKRLAEPLGPLTNRVNGRFNLNSSHMEGPAVTRSSPLDLTPIYTRKGRTNAHAFGVS